MAFFEIDGRSVYYETHGQGPSFVLLNGIMMSTRSWLPFLETLSNANQVILVDFLDQGQSDRLEGQVYDQSIQVRLLVALLDHLKLPKASFAGISYGGEVALRLAVDHPERVERLILLNTTAYTSPQLLDVGRAWNKAAATGDGQAYYYTTIPVIYSPSFYERKLDWMRRREAILIPVFSDARFTRAMIRLTLSAESHDVRERLHTIQVPTLVVSSDQDFLTPIADQKYLSAHIPGASHVVIQNTGHASMYEQPAVFLTLLLGFVNLKTTEFTI